MPLYEFTCLVCDKTLAINLTLDATQNVTCPECGDPMRRSYTFGAVTFNGKGFYKTDK